MLAFDVQEQSLVAVQRVNNNNSYTYRDVYALHCVLQALQAEYV
jgi:hypothetical protein